MTTTSPTHAGRLPQAAGGAAALVAGLAHEIRNPLHAIKLNLHTLQRAQQRGYTISSDDMKSILEQSYREIDHIELVLRRLLEFAVAEPPCQQLVDLVNEAEALVDFLRDKMRHHHIVVTLESASPSLAMRIDPGRFRQILLNLLQNAQEAMEQGGEIHVSLIGDGECVTLLVADSGPGIPPEKIACIFAPFYSTKSTGTGLGLALVKRYVEEMHGEIDCHTNAQGGATFRIRMPTGLQPRDDGGEPA